MKATPVDPQDTTTPDAMLKTMQKIVIGPALSPGGFGTNNDIGVLWPPGRAAVLVTCYLTQTSADLRVRDRAIAEVGRLVAGDLG